MYEFQWDEIRVNLSWNVCVYRYISETCLSDCKWQELTHGHVYLNRSLKYNVLWVFEFIIY